MTNISALNTNAARLVAALFGDKCPNCARVIRDSCCACGQAKIDEEVSPWHIRCRLCGFFVHELDVESLSGDPSSGEIEAFMAAQLKNPKRIYKGPR